MSNQDQPSTWFVGREAELAELAEHLESVRHHRRVGARGLAVALRGRRRIGKSALVTELVRRSELPHLHFQAVRGAPVAEQLAALADEIATSTLPSAAIAQGAGPTTLTAALRLLAAALPTETPSIVVIDELPWLLESVPGAAGELQRVWDQEISHRPVLLVLLGSDLAMMEHLDQHGEPFHGRATPMVLREMSPLDVARMTGLSGFDAFDAYLITGGQPLVVTEWRSGEPPRTFLDRSLARSTSALIVQGARVLDAEFPPDSLPRSVLSAIGGRGERTFTGIQRRLAGVLSTTSLDRSLTLLAEKRVIAADEPLSTRRARKDRRWRVSDPALRFWLAAIEPNLPDVERGRPDLASESLRSSFPAWRGRAIEPVVRESLERLLPDEQWPTVRAVGGWWPRSNTPEVDLVGTDGRPAGNIGFVGSIKWREERPLEEHDVDRLARDATAVPGVDAGTPLVGVCPAGAGDKRLTAIWRADDLLSAWQ